MAACARLLLLLPLAPSCARAWPRRTTASLRSGGPASGQWAPWGAARLTALASRDDDGRNALLTGVEPGHREAVAKVLEQATRAAARWEIAHSDFLAPPALSDCLLALRRTADIGVLVWGGHAGAERCRVSAGNAEAMTAPVRAEIECGAVAAVSVAGDFRFDTAAHGDFLGAVLNTGIVREKVGDIILRGEGGDEGAHVLVVPELVGFLCATVTRVRGVAVETSPVALSDVVVRAPSKESLKTVEASLRVDAIASAGFKVSRSKLADSISGGAVSVNWKETTKSGAPVKSGDVISLRGKGRIEVGDIRVTKKGRYAVEIFRYL